MATMSRASNRLENLGVELPSPFPSYGNYLMTARVGRILISAGHVPVDGRRIVTGKVGRDLTTEQAYEAARLAALSLLATLRAEVGDLDRIRLVYLYGTVNAVPEFAEHTAVINGASDVLVEVLGESGRHARLALGVGSLPGNVAVEIQVIAEVVDEAAPA
ncbi:MAG TPA: RidA family protein [Methylomirabilota bacterium]|jgi:enamine deaminase RidA (YjgF/YER057c/UK114 family)